MIRTGFCTVPYGNPNFQHLWQHPRPLVESWRAARSIGITDIRLQFNVGAGMTDEEPVSLHPGDWDTTLFRAFIEPAFAAGMRINANYCVGAPVPAHQDAAFHEGAAFLFAREFGHMIDSYSFENEPGPRAKAYEGDDGPTPQRDYIFDVYRPLFMAFISGVRRAVPDAWIGACDADSADIQARVNALVDTLGAQAVHLGLGHNEDWIHPYGEVLDQSYSTLAAFKAVRSSRPWGITEIDSHEPGKLYDFTASVFANPGGCTRFYFLFEGNEAELFEPVEGGAYSSFYTTQPVVNESGRKYAALFASVNGPADPVRVPVRKRAVAK